MLRKFEKVCLAAHTEGIGYQRILISLCITLAIRHKSYAMIVVLLSSPPQSTLPADPPPSTLPARPPIKEDVRDRLLQQMFMCFRCLVLQLRQTRSSY